MDQGLMEQRHPALGELLRLWEATGGRSAELTPDRLGPLATSTVRIMANTKSGLRLTDSGATVNGIYGAALDGAFADCLTPGRSDATAESIVAMESGRPVWMEDGSSGRRQVRLYLPLIESDGSVVGVLCGIVESHRA